jgi:fructoselysine-6-P-deglycase FrlB-like protein
VTEHEGSKLMAAEMSRQCADALATMDKSADIASRIAAAARETGRLVLYGIGGSHYVNRMMEPLYRQAGLDCRAMSPSEALVSPLPAIPRGALFVSQSGESGEIVELLQTAPGLDRRFGLTLNADSTLAKSVEAVIVAAGGPELAFAATRSIILGKPASIEAIATFRGTGADAQVATLFHYSSGAIVTTVSSSDSSGTNRASVVGTRGRIEIDPISYSPTKIRVYDNENNILEAFGGSVEGRGMQFQAQEAERLMAGGLIAS